MAIINWNLAKHPVNWLVIGSMVILGGFLFHLLWQKFGSSPAPATVPAQNLNNPGAVQSDFAVPPVS